MILSLIIVAFFALSFWRGWRRGLFLQLMSIFSTVIAFVAATLLYQKLSIQMVDKLKLSVPTSAGTYLFNNSVIDKASDPFFAAFVFAVLFFVVKLILRLLIILLGRFRNILSFGKIGRFIAGVLGLIVTYFSIQLILTMFSIFPATGLQNLLAGSSLAKWMITQTPISSSLLLHLFIENMIHISPF